MPRNVFGKQEISSKAEKGIDRLLGEGSFHGMRGLTKIERRIVAEGMPSVYIYNVSPIWQWNRPVIGRGEVVIQKCKPGQKVSDPLEIPGIVVRDYDRGSGLRQAYTEEGRDLAEDVLCCSQDFPGLPQNNLLNYGCFYLIGQKFEQLPVPEQQRLLDEANTKHDGKCREKVLEADQLWTNPMSKGWITEMYRLCALHIHEDREWVARRGKTSPVEECPFCGWEMKRGLAKCPNCHEIVNQELYDRLKGVSSAPKRKGEERAQA